MHVIIKAHVQLHVTKCYKLLICEKIKPSGSIAFMRKNTASVLLKQFINDNERCHTINTP